MNSRPSALLDGLALNGDAWCARPQLQGRVVDVFALCREHDVEEIVAKRVDSAYRPGEGSSDWLNAQDRGLADCARAATARALKAALPPVPAP